MKTIAGLCFSLLFLSTAHAGHAFKCHITTYDKTIDEWMTSSPMLGHGMQHYADHTISYGGETYRLWGQAYRSSEDVVLQLAGGGIHIMAKNYFYFSSASGGPSGLTVECEEQ